MVSFEAVVMSPSSFLYVCAILLLYCAILCLVGFNLLPPFCSILRDSHFFDLEIFFSFFKSYERGLLSHTPFVCFLQYGNVLTCFFFTLPFFLRGRAGVGMSSVFARTNLIHTYIYIHDGSPHIHINIPTEKVTKIDVL